MHKFSHIISLFLVCTGLVLGGCGNSSGTPQSQTGSKSDSLNILTIGTADSGGTMYPVGKAISQVIGDADSSIKVNISASTGSFGNVHSLQDGSIDLGLVSGDVAFAAVNGSGEFKDAPFKGLKVIAALYPSLSNWMARDDSGIFYVHDLKGNRLGIGPQDSTTELAAKVSLSALGITDQNSTYVNCGLGSGAEEVKNRTLDAIHGFTGVPISGLTELADAVPCHLLKYTDSELRSIIRSNSFYYMEEIPAGTYKGQYEDIATFGIKCLLCVSADMDDDLVYEITSILYENRDRLKDLHPALSYAAQTGFMYEDLPVELHPGAERYYVEKGLLQEHSR